MTDPRPVPEHTLQACLLPGVDDRVLDWIRPCQPRRDWMDKTPDRYAYRCVPLSAAASMGWELLNPVACELRWSGMTELSELKVWTEHNERFGPRSHFGSGIVTWELPFLFRTWEGMGLVVTGPPNQPRAGIVALEGFIRSDWLPFPFTMNWRVTATDTTIRFEKGEPIARIFPYPLDLLENTALEFRTLEEDPGFNQRFMDWARARQQAYQQRNQAQSRADQLQDPDLKGLWHKQYAQGTDADGRLQNRFKVKKPVDKRGKQDP